MERALHDLAIASDLDDRIEADVRFHRVLAEATGNPVFVLLLETLAGFLCESRQRTLSYSGVESALRWHRAAFQVIQARDPKQAREAMLQHLRFAARDFDQLRAKGARQRPR